MARRVFAVVLLLSLLTPLRAFSSETSELATLYTDLDNGNLYEESVAYMTEQGIVQGYDDGSFGTTNDVSRVEALKMVIEAAQLTELELELSEINEDENPFTDVDLSEWYGPYIQTGLDLGIISGYDDGTFKPEQSVNRVEILKMWIEAADRIEDEVLNQVDWISGESIYTNWYDPYLHYSRENALLIPDSDDNYLENQAVSRGELCDLIYRDVTDIYQAYSLEYGVASFYGYSWDGANTSSGKPLEVYGYQAAHQNLPFGTIVRVVNVDNGYSVEVEIVDRGPYVEGRIIDLTPAAFEEIGAISRGLYHVYIEIVERPEEDIELTEESNEETEVENVE